MKILVTGFDPFGGEKINPAIESVKKLPDEIAGLIFSPPKGSKPVTNIFIMFLLRNLILTLK